MSIFISTGEISGDLHGAALARELFRLEPGLKISGLGSERMRAAGVKILADASARSTIGFIEPIVHLPYFLKLWKKIKNELAEQRPEVVVLIDFQGINLPLAKYARSQGIKTIYYIPPQEWIWGTKRGTSEVVALSDLILSVFRQEDKFYLAQGGNSRFIGHPLLDLVSSTLGRDEFFTQQDLAKSKKLIGLFPGSRRQEINKLLPVMIKLAKKLPYHQYIISAASPQIRELIKEVLAAHNAQFQVVENAHNELMQNADLILTSSGTATLEAACLNTPMVVMYKLSALSYFIAKYILRIKIKFIALPNIIAGERIVPEFILNAPGAEKMIPEAMNSILSDPAAEQKLCNKLTEVTDSLGEKGAIKRAAEMIMRTTRGQAC
ncbi:MAG: lipid-A-disaccharide synthase [Candidatus Margulisiibacteriota bacterium]|jgi:lipid-A-disaccharide synthase